MTTAKKKEPKEDRVERALAYINERSEGKGRVRRAEDVWQPFHIRRPTGIASLDIGMGGGFPAGTLNQIFGVEGVGKNYIVDCVIAEIQKNYGNDANIAYSTFGYGYDKLFGRKNGVAVAASNLEITAMKKELAEDGEKLPKGLEKELRRKVGEFFMLELDFDPKALTKPAETLLQMVSEAIKTGVFQLLVLDETNMGETKWGADKDLDDEGTVKTADFASLMTRFLKRFWNVIKFDMDGNPNQTTVIEILESRAKIKHASPTARSLQLEQGGGMALRHAKAIDLHIRPGKYIRDKDTTIGKELNWTISKGKIGVHEGAKGTLLFRWIPVDGAPTGVDKEADLIGVGVDWGQIKKSGAHYYLSEDGSKLGQGLLNAGNFLRQNPKLRDHLRGQVLKHSGVSRTVVG